MTSKLRFITLILFVAYLISSYFTFWVETSWGVYGFLLLPIAILFSIALFGTNLKGILNSIIRVISAIILSAALWYGISAVCCSGEQGAIGLMFIGMPALCFVFLIYLLLWVIQRFKNSE